MYLEYNIQNTTTIYMYLEYNNYATYNYNIYVPRVQ